MRSRLKNIYLGAIVALFATIYGNMVLIAKSGELSIQEMDQTRGTSQMACQFQQSCDAYNHFSLNCAGQTNGTSCSTCENASENVAYLKQAQDECAGGWKYDYQAAKPMPCGGLSENAACQNNVCSTATYTEDIICSAPNVIAHQ